MEQRAATAPLQRTRFWLVLLSSAHVVPAAFISASVLLCQVCFGRPTLRFPCGFQSRACLVMLDAGFCDVYIQIQIQIQTKKIPSTGGSEEGGTRDAASGRTASPTHYLLSYSGVTGYFGTGRMGTIPIYPGPGGRILGNHSD